MLSEVVISGPETGQRLNRLPAATQPPPSTVPGPAPRSRQEPPQQAPSPRRGFSAPGRLCWRIGGGDITYDYRIVLANHRATRFTETGEAAAVKPKTPPRALPRPTLLLPTRRSRRQLAPVAAAPIAEPPGDGIRYTEPRLLETREASRRGGGDSLLRRYRFTEDFVPLRVYVVRPPVEATVDAADTDGKKGGGGGGGGGGQRRSRRR